MGAEISSLMLNYKSFTSTLKRSPSPARRIKAVADQLAASGNNISDKEKVQQTLNGLGHDYHAFITALEVLPVLPSFNELQGKLLQHEMNMKRVIERTDQGNSQNVLAMNVSLGRAMGTPIMVVVAFYQHHITKCNKKGHMKAQCWFNPQNKNKGIRHDCKQGGQSSKSTAEDMQQLLITAFSKMTIKQNEQGEWFLDSGAATHVTGNAENDVPQDEDPERAIQPSDMAQSENQEDPTQSSSHHKSNYEEQSNDSHRYSGLIYSRRLRDRDAHSEEDNMPHLRRSQRIRHPIHTWEYFSFHNPIS
ncbi:hypothetical protein EJ110_NYTH28457 [Nymphaea thermarum]|nr:hypothetical protein EJ110_NYTH28457 [Nymphaea thermarum]